MIGSLLLVARLALNTPDVTCRVRSKGVLVRSITRRSLFLRSIGVADGKVPKDHAVNHIVPLSCGGCDVPSNMELMTIAAWKSRTGPEQKDCGRHAEGKWEAP